MNTPHSSIERLEARIAPATFTVKSLANSGADTLRQAILDANMAPGADKIVFAGAAKAGTIFLSSEMAITDDLTIVGPGSSKLVLDGGGTTRIFKVDDSAMTMKTVKISGLTFERGSATVGGAIFSQENLSVSKCVFIANKATSDSGGAILATGGSANLTSCNFIGNSAQNFGGAVQLSGSTAKVVACKFLANQCGQSGGGMFLAAGLTVAPTITGSLFAGNTAAGAGGGGLAISVGNVVSPTPTLISKTIFEENSMTNANGAGGGVDIVSGKVTFSGVKFLSNRSAGNGGALDLEGLSTVLVKGSTFSGNAANLATGFGGAIHAIKSGVNQPTLTVQGGVFSANHAGYGGAIMADVGSTLNVTGAKVLNNVAQVFGGGFNIYDDGTATTSATINNTLFSGNRAIVSDGGGIVANVHGALMLTGDKFVGNYAGHDGGGAGLITTNANIFTKCQFIGNVAGSHNGGGLILGGSGGKQLVSTIFKGNFAAVSGGGLEVGSTSSAVNVIACLITGNTAVISGGGIRNDSGSPVTLGNGSKATGNTAGAQADLSGV